MKGRCRHLILTMKRKRIVMIFLICGTMWVSWVTFGENKSKNKSLLHNRGNSYGLNGQGFPSQVHYSHDVENQAKCKITRPEPYKNLSKVLLGYVNQIKNCPCNIDFVNETNLLCATADTIESVKEKIKLNFVPETLSPCVFVDKDGDNYKLAQVHSEEDRRFRFLHNPSTSELLCLPSVFLFGMPKSGTTNLHASLRYHQKIRGSQRKEMGFWNGGGAWEKESFMDDKNNTRYNMFAYLSMSQGVANTISENIRQKLQAKSTKTVLDQTLILDSSTGNCQKKAFQRLMSFAPKVKGILIMRDPVERTFSQFRYDRQEPFKRKISWINDQTPQGFHKFVIHTLKKAGDDAFSTGIYHVYVRRLLAVLPKEDIVFLQYEEFIQDPIGVIEQNILPMLGLEPFSEESKLNVSQNTLTNPSKRRYKMLPKTRILLENHFRKHNHQLSVLLSDIKWTWGY